MQCTYCWNNDVKEAHCRPSIEANKLFQLIEGIGNPSKKCSKISDESRDGCSSSGRNDGPQGSIQGNVSISWGRVILCFPVENNKVFIIDTLKDQTSSILIWSW